MGVYEEAFSAVDKTEEHGTIHLVIIKGDPEIVIDFPETVDVVVAHAVVLGEDDLDRVSPYLDLMGQSVYHIRKSAHLCNRCTLGCDGYDEHMVAPGDLFIDCLSPPLSSGPAEK